MPNLFFRHKVKKDHLKHHKFSGTFATEIIVIMLSGAKQCFINSPLSHFPSRLSSPNSSQKKHLVNHAAMSLHPK